MPDLAGLPDLLKRAALSAWPREQVAGLSGAAWHRFLDDSAGLNQFAGRLGPQLDILAYGGMDLTDAESQRLRSAARDWLRQHRRDP